MERQFINLNFKYVRVVTVQNGITWTTDRLCQQIVTAYLAYDRPGDVIAWLDREGRQETAADIHAAITLALVSAGAPPAAVHVLVNDRMSENVILADEQAIIAEFGDNAYTYTHEGINGKHLLKTLFRRKGINYKEMVDGVKMMKKIRLSRSAAKSPSVARFLTTFTRPCWWI